MNDLTDDERRAYMHRYEAAGHRMQSGIALKMELATQSGARNQETEPKHLRVGVNNAMADQGSLAKLLISKGVITEREYYEAICKGLESEAEMYEVVAQALLASTKVRLG